MSGTKVTSTKDTIDESTGTILSDSLAGESLASGGSFASGHATASSQSAKGTNTNNYDTSAATTLDAASDAEARMAAEEWGENAQMNAASRVHSGEGEYDGALGRSGPGASHGRDYGKGPEEFDEVRVDKPKGRNIKEGGFDGDGPNASFNQDIGGKNDPARFAEKKFQESNARDAASSGFEGGRAEDEENVYGTLERDEEV